MKIKFGALVTEGRGKLGGHVASKNRGGAYLRTKVTPNNPNTTAQSFVRAQLGSLSQAWNGLTAEQIAAWNGAVNNWLKTNIFGDKVVPSGKALYTSLNLNLYPTTYAALSLPPAKTEMPATVFTGAMFGIAASELTIDLVAADAGSTAVIWATPAVSGGVTNYGSRFRQLGSSIANAITPATFYTLYVDKFGAPVVGQNIAIAVQIVLPTGQVSPRQHLRATITA